MRAAGGASFPDTSRPSTWTGKSSPPGDGATLIGADVGPARLCPSPAPSLPVLVRAPHCLAQLLATGGNPWQPRILSALLCSAFPGSSDCSVLCASVCIFKSVYFPQERAFWGFLGNHHFLPALHKGHSRFSWLLGRWPLGRAAHRLWSRRMPGGGGTPNAQAPAGE